MFLLDDHEIVRRGVADRLSTESDMEVVGQAATADEALQEVAGCHPDVAVLDLNLGKGNGIETCREIRSRHPETACLILTSFSDDEALVDASLAGAAGYVLKEIKGSALVDAIRKVADGVVLLDPATVRLAMKRMRNSESGMIADLTDQERRIFDLIGEGLSNREIAEDMFLAEKTVKNYVSNLLRKLGMSRRTEAAALAARLDERHRNRFG